MAAEKKRQLNYELLRIMAMLMIVCLHYLGEGGLLGNPGRADMTAVGYAAWIVEAFCLVAVNVFVLISGYFGVDARGSMTNGKTITFREVLGKPLKIWKQVFFYSMLFGCGALMIGVQEFDIYRFFSYCFPIVTEHYWFATAYVILCLLMPFLNAGFHYLNQKEIRYLLIGLLLIFSISKTVIPMQLPWDHYGYDSLWFVVLYLTGAYLKQYGTERIPTGWKAFVLYLGSVTAMFASFFLIRMIFLRTGSLEAFINYGYSYNFLFCYTGAVGLFLSWKGERTNRVLERFRKPVELFSGAAFGVYLIHQHINIRGVWQQWVHCGEQADHSVIGFLGHMVISVFCVYLVCTMIELIRQKGSMTILPALILLLYPLRHATVGLDLMDAGYALGNYRFFDSLNEMWKLATYLANITGVILSRLPFGGTWAGMNGYCGLLIGAVAAGVYLFLWKRYGQKQKLFCWLLFAAELTALSLCWSPVVVLYQYLGYLLMTVAVMVLYTAITEERKKYFVIAGVILGLCVAVRMPNVTYMALILPVWCDCFWNHGREGNRSKKLVTHTLYCVGGYLTGVLVPLAVICVRYGMAAYPRMVTALFGMTDHATDYKPASMVTAMFGDYIRYSIWLLLFVVYMAVGVVFFHMLDRFVQSADKTVDKSANKKKITYVFRTLYVLGLLVVLRFCYGRGMFNFDYSRDFSMYKWVTVYLLIEIILCIGMILNKKTGSDFKLWAVFLLVITFITPLGSNNGLFPMINNLFLVMPVSILMIAHLFRKGSKPKNFAFWLVLGCVLVCTAIQSVLFGIGFVFHDEGVQENNNRAGIELQCSNVAAGLVTTRDKKETIEELDAYLYQNNLNKKRVILYGEIPAIAYLMDMEPAIFTTWADLDSNSMDTLKEELNRLSDEAVSDTLPVIIVGRFYVENLTKAEELPYQKWRLIMDFAEKNGYRERFANEEYIVLTADSRSGE